MSNFLYFAYGSNMLAERLVARCPSTKVIGQAKVVGYRVEFWKISNDGSGKATLVSGNNTGTVNGVLFEIDRSELLELDKAEGAGAVYRKPGYKRVESFKVIDEEGKKQIATTYLANDTHIDKASLPYDWYVALVKAGAKQNKVRGLSNKIIFQRDKRARFKTRTAALIALSNAGRLREMDLEHYKTSDNEWLNW